eukprot:Rhum_TRINITY_DN6422_c0_g1::Rhum_TRINITY_DN6422_c0_g1_i1::g.20090::m.20090
MAAPPATSAFDFFDPSTVQDVGVTIVPSSPTLPDNTPAAVDDGGQEDAGSDGDDVFAPPPPAAQEEAKRRGAKRSATEAAATAGDGAAAAAGEPAAQRRRDKAYCFYYKGGGSGCREGDSCPYIHDDAYARRLAAEEAEALKRRQGDGGGGGGGAPRTPFAAALHEEVQARRVFVRPIVPPTDAEEARQATAAVQAAVAAALAASSSGSSLADDVRTQRVNARNNFAVVTTGCPEAADALVAREGHMDVAWGSGGSGGGGGASRAWAHRPHEFDAASPYRRTTDGVGRVARAKGHRVFVAGLGGVGALPDGRLAAIFGVAGQVVAVQRGWSAELGKQQHCFVEFATGEGARAAIELFHGNAYKGPKGEGFMLSVTPPM